MFVRLACGSFQNVEWHLLCSIKRERLGQKLFLTIKIAFFPRNFEFSTTSYVLKNALTSSRVIAENTWDCIILFLEGFHMRYNEERSAKILVIVKTGFLKCLFLSTARASKKLSYHLQNKYQHTLCTQTICPMTFFMFDKTRENKPKLFLRWKGCIFFKALFFQQPLRSWKEAFIGSTVLAKLACGPLQILPWGFSQAVWGGKMGQNFFFAGKAAFFFRTLFLQQPFRS